LEGHVPIYEYRCSSCGFQKEYLQKIRDPLLSSCPECGKESFQKMLTTAGFQLKGSGWYASDFKGSGTKPPEKTKTAKAAEPAKAEAPACGAGACAACPVAESGS
jgi:putative FmdB family regulatory protein